MGRRYRNDAGEAALPASHAGWRGECGWSDAFCYEYGKDTSSIANAATTGLIALAVAWAVCIATAYNGRRGNARKWKLHWCGVVLGLLCCAQYYFLFRAANVASPSYSHQSVRRHDCVESKKGGKVSSIGSKNRPGVQENPCYCHPTAKCYIEDTGAYVLPADCPRDDTAQCTEGDGGKIDPKIANKFMRKDRDCENGRGSRCTKRWPCTPCELEKLKFFPEATSCAFCSDINTGECAFDPDSGPYCYKSPGSREVEPCRKCCTEPLIKFAGPFFNPTANPIVPFYKCQLKYVQNNETENMTEPVDDDEFPWWKYQATLRPSASPTKN